MSNRLIHETSPYLLQHAHNPVDWYAWGEEALQKARDENKIILVSIGYSACHWCHVMERESFENADTAAVMNRNFINIKIDREERPDLDQVYMDAVQTLTGSGGWPLNVFLTPEAKPFYGGTYFPPVQAYNRNSWRQTLGAVHDAWQAKPEEIRSQAENLTDHLSKAGLVSLPNDEVVFSVDDLQIITDNLLKNADAKWGGFGRAPKFPQTFSIQFLLRQFYHDQKAAGIVASLPEENAEGFNHSAAVKQALLSLDKMIMGGIYDQLQGGFARYSTDHQWLAPHFEKMLYDNALLVSVMSEAYQLTGKEIYKTAIEETMQFVQDEWQDEDGGFFSAYDADSEGEEGKYYTWQASEIDALIVDKEQAEIFKAYYGVEKEGNWEHTNILWIKEPIEEFCSNRQLDEASTRLMIDSCKKILLAARKHRPKPLLDDKKLMGWNALMITACCKAWAALGNDEYLTMAERAHQFVENYLHKEDVYYHNYKNGKAANPAFLDDYSNYIYGLIHLQEITGNTQFLQKARVLTELVLQEFGDDETSFFFYTSANQKDIIFRKIDVYDGATSSGNSVMAYNLFYLGIVFDEAAWKEKSIGMVSAMKKLALNYPTSFSIWGQLLQWIVYGVNEIAVIGKTKAGNSQVLHYFIPNKVVQTATETNDDFPLLSGKNVPAADFIIYICQQFQCKQPVFELKKALSIVV